MRPLCEAPPGYYTYQGTLMIYEICTNLVCDIRLDPLRDLTWNNLLECACHTSSNFMTPPAVIRDKTNAFQ